MSLTTEQCPDFPFNQIMSVVGNISFQLLPPLWLVGGLVLACRIKILLFSVLSPPNARH
ncbi:hypothetical protein BDV23DRAFT_156825 [Aspergillus alliaceus]|uniref:Uncharacterized protein n=1 Tax=Petromyces alliaceus TaxID=209559 RepID=A0A5N7C6K3_PETAA|nr:hypothetical protein BDV23DRAFT_156825 [Aspergillus alliaceus]